MADEKENVSVEEIPLDDLAAEPIDLDEAMSDAAEIERLQAENDELRDRMMRALADAENSRKRGERDRRDAELYGGLKLARDLLSVYDNMKRAVDTVTDEQRESSQAVIEGIELTMRELISTFSKHHIERQAPEVGEKFDPQIHQAMFEAPVPTVPNGHIIQMMAEGFTIGERLLRPAHVGVSSTPAVKQKKVEPEATEE